MTKKKLCVVCGRQTSAPVFDALHHFRLVQWGQWKYWLGNIKAFGFWSGLAANITLSFPIVNTLVNWKHRRSTLEIPR